MGGEANQPAGLIDACYDRSCPFKADVLSGRRGSLIQNRRNVINILVLQT